MTVPLQLGLPVTHALRMHSFHGAAIIEVGCGGARTRCAYPVRVPGARTEVLA